MNKLHQQLPLKAHRATQDGVRCQAQSCLIVQLRLALDRSAKTYQVSVMPAPEPISQKTFMV